RRHVAVRREADVVELDLVEPCLGRGGRDVDVVLPHARVVLVRPAQAGGRLPAAAGLALDAESGLAVRQRRVLEGDHAADQVDAGAVSLLDDLVHVVVRPGCADLPRQGRHVRADEADVAVLVLDVELDRVEAVRSETHVVLDPPGDRREALGDVDAADLGRQAAVEGALRAGRMDLRSDLPGLRCAVPSRRDVRRPSGNRGGDSGQGEERDHPPHPTAAACLVAALAEAVVRVESVVEEHEGNYTLHPLAAHRKPVFTGLGGNGLAGRPAEALGSLYPAGATSFGESGWKIDARYWICPRPGPSSNWPPPYTVIPRSRQ